MTHREIIAKVWSGWNIERKIGEGSYGKVFKVVKQSGGMVQESAVKVIRIPSEEEEFEKVQEKFALNRQEAVEYFYPEVERFKKEILLMKELGEESNIVRILDFEIENDPGESFGWYILIRMELLESLETLIRKRDLSLGDALSLGEDILCALKACEAHSILHRDIKPDNLFYTPQGNFMLGDFGIARELKENSLSLSHRGTDNYMAPEVYQGKHYTHNADIYSLGIVLYKLLNKNRLPFLDQGKLTAASLERAFQKRQSGEALSKPLHASSQLFAILEKMCAFDPGKRFQRAEEVLERLQDYRREHEEELLQSLEIGRGEVPDSVIHKKQSSSTREETPAKPEGEEPSEYFSREEGDFIQEERDFREGTQKLYPQKEEPPLWKQSSRSSDSSWEDIEKALGRIQGEPEQKKGGIKLWTLAAGMVCILAALGTILFFRLNSRDRRGLALGKTTGEEVQTGLPETPQSTEETEGEAWYLSEDVFALDMAQLPEGSYLEYTINLWIPSAGEVKERSGIYVGEQTEGVPQGEGAFFYQTEGQGEDNNHYLVQNVYSGEWENGVLKSGTTVKQRKKNILTFENGDVKTFIYRFEDIWDQNNFRDNMRGSFEYTFTKGETGEEIRQSFVGVFNKDNTSKLNGTEYTDSEKYVGDYRDNRFYNGTLYSLEGEEIGTVTEGEVQYHQ